MTERAPRGLAEATSRGRCPRCAAPTLFKGWISFAARCRSCGLDYAHFNVGDGPATFLTLIVGGLVVVLAIWLELTVGPPFWAHVLLWLLLTIALVLGGLRLAEAALLHIECRGTVGDADCPDLHP